MNKSLNHLIIFILLVLYIVLFSIGTGAQNYSGNLNPNIFSELTKKRVELSTLEKNKTPSFDIYATLIHPDESIHYGGNLIDLENKLKKDYDLIYINFSLGEISIKNFSLYNFKKELKLIIDDNLVVNSVDFYDFDYNLRGTAHFSKSSLDFEGNASLWVSGYLLFPKTIKNDHKKIELEGNYKIINNKNDNQIVVYTSGEFEEEKTENYNINLKAQWNLEKINQTIEIMK
jgi:hypothetical protein